MSATSMTRRYDPAAGSPWDKGERLAALDPYKQMSEIVGSGPLKFCHEAGPCGHGVHRTLVKLGEDCTVALVFAWPRDKSYAL